MAKLLSEGIGSSVVSVIQKEKPVQAHGKKRKDKFPVPWAKGIQKVAQLTLKSLSAPLMALGGGLI